MAVQLMQVSKHSSLREGTDRAAHRAWLVALTDVPAGGTAIDLGCGRGEDLRMLATRHPVAARLVGVDASAEALAIAADETADPRIHFERASLDRRLPFDDGAVDLVYSQNLPECLPTRRALRGRAPVFSAPADRSS